MGRMIALRQILRKAEDEQRGGVEEQAMIVIHTVQYSIAIVGRFKHVQRSHSYKRYKSFL